MREEKNTAMVLEELNNATTLRKGLSTIEDNKNNFVKISFGEYFNRYLASHSELRLADIIRDSGLSRQYAYSVADGTKNASRDRIIALCFAAGMNRNEMDHALIHAGHSVLYPKDNRDAYIIVAIASKCRGDREIVTATDLSIFLAEKGQEPLNI